MYWGAYDNVFCSYQEDFQHISTAVDYIFFGGFQFAYVGNIVD